MLIENVHPQADHAEIKDFLTQGGTVVHLELFRDYHIATVSMGYFLFPSLKPLCSHGLLLPMQALVATRSLSQSHVNHEICLHMLHFIVFICNLS